MRVLVLYNPVSGAGKAGVAGRALFTQLRDAGHEPVLMETRLLPTQHWLDAELAACEALVVVGGDGAIRLAAAAAARTRTPIYQYPFGTENLFAREFGMDRSLQTLLGALAEVRVIRADLGTANGRDFLLMASVGFDANVVHDLSRRRTGGITHLSYAMPIVRQLAAYQPPCVSVMVDEHPVELIQQRSGWIVVSNCRQYGARLDPSPHADMTDGLLDITFLPVCTRRRLLSTMLRYRFGRQLRDASAVRVRGRSVEIRTTRPGWFQLDGDPPGPTPPTDEAPEIDGDLGDGRIFHLIIQLHPGTLPVLCPPGFDHA
jgi:diacylglycerol kinase (ATP)